MFPLGLLILFPFLGGASYRTTNFAVEANSPDVARKVAEHAELCRTTIAQAWLGHDLANWKTPCPVRVRLTAGEAGGLTSFGFHQGRVSDQSMTVEGRLDRVLASALPHEITHTIFAAYFGGPMPRWADEAARCSARTCSTASVTTRSRSTCSPAAASCRWPACSGRELSRDLMGFYGQGYSISRFLIEMGGRPRFLEFVRDGMKDGWDTAARAHYQLANVRELDRAWRSWHRVAVQGGQSAQTEDIMAFH